MSSYDDGYSSGYSDATFDAQCNTADPTPRTMNQLVGMLAQVGIIFGAIAVGLHCDEIAAKILSIKKR